MDDVDDDDGQELAVDLDIDADSHNLDLQDEEEDTSLSTSTTSTTAESDNSSLNNKFYNNTRRNVVPNCLSFPQKQNSDVINVAIINARSALNKIDDIGAQFSDRQIDICICSQTWQTNKELSDELIESLEETYGVTWVGKGRFGRRGGGVSVITSNTFADVRALEISDRNLETVWVLATPKYDKKLTLVISAFYSSTSPDFKPDEDELQDHYMDHMEQINKKFGQVQYILGGDLNKDSLDNVINLPNYQQVVDKATRKDKTLDKCVTTLEKISCTILPPLQSDSCNTESDHDIALCELRLPTKGKKWIKIYRRKYTREAAEEFERRILDKDWEFLKEIESADGQDRIFNKFQQEQYEELFPYTATKVREGEPLFFHAGLRRMHKKLGRLSCRRGAKARQKYVSYRKAFKKKFKLAKNNFYNKLLDSTVKTDSARWNSEIKKLISNGGQRDSGELLVAPELRGFSDKEKANAIAEDIESITRDYEELDVDAIKSSFPNGKLPLLEIEDVVSVPPAVACQNHPSS